MIDKRILNEIDKYHPKGMLGHTAITILNTAAPLQHMTKEHMERVGIFSGYLGEELKENARMSFFGGLLHDTGKIIMPYQLFDGHAIVAEEYTEIKKHAKLGFLALKDIHLCTSFCAGWHHGPYHAGYGITLKDLPDNLPLLLIMKMCSVARIVSMCDFIDAYLYRPSQDGKIKTHQKLEMLLLEKYRVSHEVIQIAMDVQKKLKFD